MSKIGFNRRLFLNPEFACNACYNSKFSTICNFFEVQHDQIIKSDYFDRNCIRIFSLKKFRCTEKHKRNTISRAESSAPEKNHWLAQVGKKHKQTLKTHKKHHFWPKYCFFVFKKTPKKHTHTKKKLNKTLKNTQKNTHKKTFFWPKRCFFFVFFPCLTSKILKILENH